MGSGVTWAEVTPGPGSPHYTVRRSTRAKRARLTVTADGDAVVVLPQRAPLASAAILVERHEAWLRRHLARADARRAPPGCAAARWVPAGCLSVNGIPHRVRLDGSTGCRAAACARSWTPTRTASWACWRSATRPRRLPVPLLERWLRERARDVLQARVESLAPVVGVRPTSVSVRDQQTRWGSASKAGLAVVQLATPAGAARSCWTPWWCTSWRTCGMPTMVPRSGRSPARTHHGRTRRAAGCGTNRTELRSALD